MAASGFRNRLLGTRLSSAGGRLVKSFFYGESGFSMAIVWGRIVIGCVGIENRRRKAVPSVTVHARVGTLRQR